MVNTLPIIRLVFLIWQTTTISRYSKSNVYNVYSDHTSSLELTSAEANTLYRLKCNSQIGQKTKGDTCILELIFRITCYDTKRIEKEQNRTKRSVFLHGWIQNRIYKPDVPDSRLPTSLGRHANTYQAKNYALIIVGGGFYNEIT